MLPTLIRSRPAPTLFGAGFLYDIHIFQYVSPGIKGLQRIGRIQIASGTVIVAKHLQPVGNAAHDQFRCENIRHSSVGKLDVNLGVILNVIVASPKKAFIAIVGKPRNLMRAAAYRGWPNRFAISRLALNPLQIKRGAHRMASLPDQRSATGEFPAAVVRRVRPAVGLLSQDAKYLAATLLDDLPFLLNRRSINPVLGIADPLATSLRRSQNAGTTCRS